MTGEQAKDIILRMVSNFPGLVDGETETDGAEVVEWISNEFHYLVSGGEGGELIDRALNGSP